MNIPNRNPLFLCSSISPSFFLLSTSLLPTIRFRWGRPWWSTKTYLSHTPSVMTVQTVHQVISGVQQIWAGVQDVTSTAKARLKQRSTGAATSKISIRYTTESIITNRKRDSCTRTPDIQEIGDWSVEQAWQPCRITSPCEPDDRDTVRHQRYRFFAWSSIR